MADTTVVAPFKRPSDVDVVMDVVHPKPIVGLGNLLILNFVDPAQVSAGGKSGGDGVVPAQKASDKIIRVLSRCVTAVGEHEAAHMGV